MAVISTEDEEQVMMEIREASPAHFLFHIESFSLLSKYGIEEYESREFTVGDYKWRLIIYPNGNEGDKDHLSVYLAVADTSALPASWEINASFRILLFNHISGNYLSVQGQMRRYLTCKSKWGFPKFISKKIFTDPSNGYLVDDSCAFGAEVFIIKSERVIERLSLMEAANPFKRDWKILQFSKLGNTWTSNDFVVGDHKWYIMLYPKGNTVEADRHVSIFLYSTESKKFAAYQKVRADYSLCLKDQLNNKHWKKNLSRWFSSSSNNWGWHDFMPISDMVDSTKGFVVEDCCILEIEMSVQAVASALP